MLFQLSYGDESERRKDRVDGMLPQSARSERLMAGLKKGLPESRHLAKGPSAVADFVFLRRGHLRERLS